MTHDMINPTFQEFREYAQQADLVPVWREILFDTHTAVTAYAALARAPFGFLLESVIGGSRSTSPPAMHSRWFSASA